ncbi:MAG: hypothetical protein S4CHLAM20_13080 [Chlamydiia bacterium]|nr:hypothetical protein [Chlamydiia bacterium]
MSDKPIECSKCNRRACVNFKEMKDGKVNNYSMCKSCPLLKEKLYENEKETKEASIFTKETSQCPVCHLSKEDFIITLTFGCDSCIKTFKDTLTQELLSQDLIPQSIKDNPEAFHLGNSPKNHKNISFSETMENLHLALNEAIESEHFEEAAAIRDKIKNQLENPNANAA